MAVKGWSPRRMVLVWVLVLVCMEYQISDLGDSLSILVLILTLTALSYITIQWKKGQDKESPKQ
jgi:hypothetical protein